MMPTDRPKKIIATARPEIIRATNFSNLDWLIHGFSTRQGNGSDFTLGNKSDVDGDAVERNRKLFLEGMRAERGGKVWPLVTLKQVHSDVIHYVERPESQLVGDGLLTNKPGLVIAVGTADCLPVLIADPVHKAVGAFHAGWRGTLARIVEKGVGELRRRFGSVPAALQSAIGPGIHGCCYAVGDELREKFEAQFAYARELFREIFDSDPVRERYPLLFMTARAPGHSNLGPTLHLDLVEANRRQLVEAGVPEENIWASELCTACRTDLLFSYRAEGAGTGRMLGAIGVRGNTRHG